MKKIASNIKRSFPRSDYDDLVQTGWVAVLEAINTYTVGRGTKRSTWIAQNIIWKMMDEVRGGHGAESPAVMMKQAEYVAIDDIDLRDKAPSPLNVVVYTQLIDDMMDAVAHLPERQREVIFAWMNDKHLGEIGAALGVHRSRAGQLKDQAIARLRRGLKHHATTRN